MKYIGPQGNKTLFSRDIVEQIFQEPFTQGQLDSLAQSEMESYANLSYIDSSTRGLAEKTSVPSYFANKLRQSDAQGRQGDPIILDSNRKIPSSQTSSKGADWGFRRLWTGSDVWARDVFGETHLRSFNLPAFTRPHHILIFGWANLGIPGGKTEVFFKDSNGVYLAGAQSSDDSNSEGFPIIPYYGCATAKSSGSFGMYATKMRSESEKGWVLNATYNIWAFPAQ